MTYTERVMQQAATAVAVTKLSDQDYEKLMQEKWQKRLADSASRIAHTPAPVGHLPPELRGEILPPQPLSTPIRGWIDGNDTAGEEGGKNYRTGVVGLFKWTLLAESRHSKRSPRTRVERPGPSQLGIERLIMMVDRSTGDRIPWNTGVKQEMEKGAYGMKCARMDAKPEDKKVIPHMEPISYLSDANKIAWIRAFLGWAYKAMMIQDVNPQVDMCEHTGIVHFLLELYTRISVKGAKPLSEIGQGIPVYAAGQEIRTGREGLMTSDWGNKLFVDAGRRSSIPSLWAPARKVNLTWVIGWSPHSTSVSGKRRALSTGLGWVWIS